MASAPVSPAARRHAKMIFHRLAVLITTLVLATVGVSIPAMADTITIPSQYGSPVVARTGFKAALPGMGRLSQGVRLTTKRPQQAAWQRTRRMGDICD
jgi:hypothetical protein